MPDQVPVVFRRDQLTWSHYAVLSIFGYFIYLFSACMPLLRDDHGTSATIAGAHVVVYAVGTVGSGLFSDRIVIRLGRRRVLWNGLFGFGVVSVALLAVAPGPWLSLPGALAAGVATNLLINVVTASLADRHGPYGSSAINEANALASAMGVVAPLALAGVLALGWNWRIALLLVVGMTALSWLAFGGVAVPDAVRKHPDGSGPSPLPPAFWPAWLSLMLCGSFEFCFTVWSSDVLRDHAGASDSLAALGVSAVVVGIVVGRLVTARMPGRRLDHLLYGFLVVVLAGFCTFWLSPGPVLAIAGLLVAGIGIGPMYPVSVARLIEASGRRSDLATARASIAMGVAIGGGPFAIGVVADQVGAYRAMLIVPVLLVAAAGVVRWSAAAGAGITGGPRP